MRIIWVAAGLKLIRDRLMHTSYLVSRMSCTRGLVDDSIGPA